MLKFQITNVKLCLFTLDFASNYNQYKVKRQVTVLIFRVSCTG